ncbi:MAG TPA: carboxypeptidase-like regulatory domain-containing protein [Acidisarcina sp.]
MLLVSAFTFPVLAAEVPSVISGVVRDARGNPQVGTLVELLLPNTAIAASAFTDERGRYILGRVAPGTYGLKATGTLFLPTLRQNLHVNPHTRTVVNLTLSTLYEAFQWLPATRRPSDEPQDDWAWTLRSSANRPLLRLLDEGPLVVVSDSGTDARKARVVLNGGANKFGDGGIHHAFELERAENQNGRLILRADLSATDHGTLASASTLAGYEEQLTPESTFRTVVAFENMPGLEGTASQHGLQSLVIRSAETLRIAQLELEAGNDFEFIRMGRDQAASHPFAGISWNGGDNTVSYRITTALGVERAEELDLDASVAPRVSESNGNMQLERGLHQALTYQHDNKQESVKVVYYRDHVVHPVVDGGGSLSPADLQSGDVVYDPLTGLMKAAGEAYSAQGMQVEVKQRLGGDTWLSLGVADGDALSIPDSIGADTLVDELAQLTPRRAQMYSVAVSGRLTHSGTHWRGSYRWQPGDTVTAVAPFDSDTRDAYLSLYLRQPIRLGRMLPNGTEALIDMRNLLAQGYRPFITADGSTLYFAQADRSIRGGLSFTF